MFRNSKQRVSGLLTRNTQFFTLWCFVASFGAYFSMYAFRKPFNAALFLDGESSFLTSKAFFIIAQVLGYMCSKFIGVKVISELKPNQRVRLILLLILIAEFALFFFAIAPLSFKFIFLFLNGLPLGMVWGVVFSFLEGRRVTEFIASGLCISAIVSSGFLKSFGRYFIEEIGVLDFWMPFLIGLIFVPVFLFFVWMLWVIPKPNSDDIRLKKKRVPMTKLDRSNFLNRYKFGLLLLIASYAMLSVFRDFRDNFSVEIWSQINEKASLSIFLETESIVGIIVVLLMGLFVFFKNNTAGLKATFLIIAFGFATLIVSTLLFQRSIISGYEWIISSGVGLYMSYVPFQVVIYEKLIAWLNERGNAGFLMYLSDSTGYFFAVAILTGTEFLKWEVDWLNFIINAAYFTGIIGVIQLLLSFIYFMNKEEISNQTIKESYEKHNA
ncbi:DUF5690 family protein [Crocinitomix algicola]|uniref:DUF5690 family protein n=1 Tax=Crocinitomix algicola TaxID=1740263 RepID=UPI0008377E3F|nr:DUF5690 family protein [Crocinitomix algicola]